jgi:hypothetical protein
MARRRKEVVWMTEAEGQAPEATESPVFEKEYVEGLRGEAANWRTKLRDSEKRVEALEGKLQEYEDANKSELEKLASDKAKLEKELEATREQARSSAIDTAIKLAAAKAGVIDPDAALALIDRSEIDFTGGSVTGVDKALKKLLKEKTYLVGDETPPPPTPGAGGSPIGTEPNNLDGALLKMFQAGAKR